MVGMENAGYIDPSEFGDLKETGALVYGPGAKNDNAGRALVKPSSSEATQIQKAKKYAMEVSIKMVLMKQTLSHQQAQTKALQRQQAISIMCRIYVGCINYDTREESIKQAFNAFGPIRSITMSWDPVTQKHKGFAFVEFDTPEGAQLAEEQMNGVLVCGRNIKVGRPSQMPQAQACIDEIQAESKGYHRIYVSSIHKDLADEDIRSVFSAFGTIKNCNLANAGVPGRHKGYGYIEYDSLQSALDAISSMNLFDLGGQYLRVGRAVTPPDAKNVGLSNAPPSALPTATAMAAAAVSAKITALDAVASSMGVNTDDLANKSKGKKKRRSRSRSKSRDREERKRKEEKEKSEKKVKVEKEDEPNAKNEDLKAVPVPPLIAKDDALETTDALKSAALAAHQLELKKKLDEGQEPVTLSQQEDMSIKGQSARQLVMQKLMKNRSESVVLLLRNMVGPDEVDEDLQSEIETECTNYGKVEQVIIYNERQDEGEDAEVIVKIFVEFEKFEQVKKAREALHGRFFSGRKVNATLYDQELFDQQDLSG